MYVIKIVNTSLQLPLLIHLCKSVISQTDTNKKFITLQNYKFDGSSGNTRRDEGGVVRGLIK